MGEPRAPRWIWLLAVIVPVLAGAGTVLWARSLAHRHGCGGSAAIVLGFLALASAGAVVLDAAAIIRRVPAVAVLLPTFFSATLGFVLVFLAALGSQPPTCPT